MDFDGFLKKYDGRVKAYVSKFRRAWRLPYDFADDLHQVCLLAIWKNLPYWRDMDNGKSAFNWCAGPMRRAMESALKSHHGAKPYSNSLNLSESVEWSDTYANDSSAANIEEIIDLKRLLTADPKPQHVVRFIATALSPASGADIARAHGISRQAVCISVSKTRKRLRSAWA